MRAAGLLPRGVEYWHRELGFFRRCSIQALQWSKHSLRAVNFVLGKVPAIERKITSIEATIELLQTDITTKETGAKITLWGHLQCLVENYRRLFEEAPIGMHTLEVNGSISDANNKWLELLGYQKSEVVGRSIFDLIVPEQRENARERFLARIAGQAVPPKTEDRQYLTSSGERITVRTRDTDLRDEQDKVFEIITTFEDTTDLTRAQTQLVSQERQAAVGQLAGAMSHIYKNQIAEMVGYVRKVRHLSAKLTAFQQILSTYATVGRSIGAAEISFLSVLSGELQKVVEGFSSKLQKMDQTTKRVLSFSRLGTEEKTIISIRDKLEDIAEGLVGLGEGRDCSLCVKLETLTSEDGCLISESGFQDLIRNLLTNAFESGASRVTLTAEKTARNQIKLVVADNGLGIAPERLAKIFSDPRSTKKSGTGLGMIAIKNVVDAAGGKIQILSGIGEGTSLTILLPWAKYSPTEPAKPAAAPPAQQMKLNQESAAQVAVMVVDDAPEVLVPTAGRIEEEGFRVWSFSEPEKALAAYLAVKEKPGVVVVDLGMKGLNGWELIEKIVAAAAAPLPRFIVFSGGPGPEIDRELKSMTDKFAAHFVYKGAEEDKLIAMVHQAAQQYLDNVPLGEKGGVDLETIETVKTDNPFQVLGVRLAHKTNNLLTALLSYANKAYDPQNIDPNNLRQFMAAFGSLIHTSQLYREFVVAAGGLINVEKATELPLPQDLITDKAFQAAWAALQPEARYKLAILIEMYLRAGLGAFRNEVERIVCGIGEGSIKPEQIKTAADRLQKVHYGMFLASEREPEQAAKFKALYHALQEMP